MSNHSEWGSNQYGYTKGVGMYHTVRPGDTVDSIAAANGLQSHQVAGANQHLIKNGQVYPGQRLRVG